MTICVTVLSKLLGLAPRFPIPSISGCSQIDMEIIVASAAAQSRGDLGRAVAKEPTPLPRPPGPIRQGRSRFDGGRGEGVKTKG